MHKILQDILKSTKEEVEKRKNESVDDVITSFGGRISFKDRILKPNKGDMGLIGEIKLASPVVGVLREKVDALNRLLNYQNGGVDAISVITEKNHFKGSLELVSDIKKSISNLPILQKDFIIDDFQIEESRLIGADALLLIARIVDADELKRFVKLCKDAGIEPVVEIHTPDDLAKAVESGTEIIAVNARDLDTFTVDVNRACQILKSIPERFIKLGFSGIHSRAEVEKYKESGANAVLVGTELMRASDIEKFIKELKNVS